MKLEVGDRVRVYDGFRGNSVGIVREIMEGLLLLEGSSGTITTNAWFHPKQCRKLVKRERRRVWIHRSRLEPGREHEDFSTQTSSREYDGMVEFIEVRGPKR